ncbi:hypothetical protein MMC25_001648 [Agyrium rufum]|nr:hypothetical protein [Agyrium rufum]
MTLVGNKSVQRNFPQYLVAERIHKATNPPARMPDVVTHPKPSRTRVRVDNLHYDLTEDDLEDLFTRIAPISNLNVRYDRAGRSTGTAFVTYPSISSARRAIQEFDGANANGQPIRLALLPSAPAASSATTKRNPFDTAVRPAKSLFDRVEDPAGVAGGIRGRGDRNRSRSPGRRDRNGDRDRNRREEMRSKVPEGVDRYVPEGDSRGGGRRDRHDDGEGRQRDGGARGGDRGGRGGTRRNRSRDEGGRKTVQGRPRMTQEELDREMEDYWGSGTPNTAETLAVNGSSIAPAAPGTTQMTGFGAPAAATAAASVTEVAPHVGAVDDDIDMIE